MKPPRDFVVGVRGFDFDEVRVRAHGHGQARYLVADAYHDAGFGTVLEGMRHVISVRLDTSGADVRLCNPNRDVGLLYVIRGAAS